jgi:hypothetical protein
MYDTGGIRIRMSMRKVMKKIFVGTSKMIRKVFLRKKILGELSLALPRPLLKLGKYLKKILGKYLKKILGELSPHEEK